MTVRAVNHRFLDLQLRIPPSLAAARAASAGWSSGRSGAGAIEVSVSIQQRRVPTLEVELNEAFLGRSAAPSTAPASAGSRRADDPGRPAALSAGALDQGEGGRRPGADEALSARVEEAVAAALDELDTMRVREGGYLRADLDARRAVLAELFARVHAGAESGMAALPSGSRSACASCGSIPWSTSRPWPRRS